MKAILSAIILSLAFSIPVQAKMDVDLNKAWKVTNLEDGGSELVFDPVFLEDPETHLKWMVATSCDPKAEECAAFEFNVDHIQMTKVTYSIAKQFLDGEIKAF